MWARILSATAALGFVVSGHGIVKGVEQRCEADVDADSYAQRWSVTCGSWKSSRLHIEGIRIFPPTDYVRLVVSAMQGGEETFVDLSLKDGVPSVDASTTLGK